MSLPTNSSLPTTVSSFKYFILLWLLFFAICFGLGYPTLRRYDPRNAEGMSDTWKYYWMTRGENVDSVKELFRGRILVPYVARPFFWFAQKYRSTEQAAFFGLLVANALFCATTACLIVSIGHKLLHDLATALLGATLYLLSFAISNLQLSGLIDSGEACFLAALVWSLLNGCAFLLPLWAILGALAKETFVPFSTLFAFTWWYVERSKGKRDNSQLKWIVILAVAGLTMVSVVHSVFAGALRWPWQIAAQAHASGNFLVALGRCLTDRSFWYVFAWLIPLGIWRLKFFPKQWLAAALATSILALMFGAYNNTGGTVARAIFDICGPLLSLSVAVLISRADNVARVEQ